MIFTEVSKPPLAPSTNVPKMSIFFRMAAAMNAKINKNKMPFEITLDCISMASLGRLLKYHKIPPKSPVIPASQVRSTGSNRLIFCFMATMIRPVIVVA